MVSGRNTELSRHYNSMKPAPGVVGRCRCTLSLQKIGSGSAILAYKPARLLPPFRIFDFVLNTSPRQNANKFAFALGLFVSLHFRTTVYRPSSRGHLHFADACRTDNIKNERYSMALQCGIVGLPNVGKSTLFNCLSNAKAQAANFPFCTIEPNVGVITVPDERLIRLCLLYTSPSQRDTR